MGPYIGSIAIEASALMNPVRTGIQVYTENLLQQLISRPDELRVRLFHKVKPFRGAARPVGFPGSYPYIHAALARTGDARITHSPDNKFLYKRNRVNVVTLHDVAIFLPEHNIEGYTTSEFRSRQFRIYGRLLERADRVIAVSETTRSDISRVFAVDQGKIDVVYHGISSFETTTPDDERLTLNSLGLQQQQYLLFVGAVSIRKNILGLLDAYSRTAIKNDLKLVLAGPYSMGSERIAERVASLGLSNSVVFTSYVRDKVLATLYRNARAFVFPTYYEGFGMPILEAMSFGLPILIGNRGAASEIAGGLAIEVDPFSIDEIEAGIVKVTAGDHDESMLKTHAAKFTWNRCADEMCRIYRELVT